MWNGNFVIKIGNQVGKRKIIFLHLREIYIPCNMGNLVALMNNAIILFSNGKYPLLYIKVIGLTTIAILLPVTKHALRILNYSYCPFMSCLGIKRDILIVLQARLGKSRRVLPHKKEPRHGPQNWEIHGLIKVSQRFLFSQEL